MKKGLIILVLIGVLAGAGKIIINKIKEKQYREEQEALQIEAQYREVSDNEKSSEAAIESDREKKHELVFYIKGSNIYHTNQERCDASEHCDIYTGEYTREVIWDFEDELGDDKIMCDLCRQVEINRDR